MKLASVECPFMNRSLGVQPCCGVRQCSDCLSHHATHDACRQRVARFARPFFVLAQTTCAGQCVASQHWKGVHRPHRLMLPYCGGGIAVRSWERAVTGNAHCLLLRCRNVVRFAEGRRGFARKTITGQGGGRFTLRGAGAGESVVSGAGRTLLVSRPTAPHSAPVAPRLILNCHTFVA
jgi:hypothetical protein